MNKKKKKKIQRQCWDLDYAFFEWLRKRLKVYYKDANKIVDLKEKSYVYNGIEMTQEEAILHMIELLDIIHIEATSDYKAEQEVLELWALWAPTIWW